MSLLSRLADKRIAAYQRTLIETHYDEVESMYARMRGWRHDYRNHIQALRSYASLGDLGAVLDYLDALDADLSSIEHVIKTGNRMADAILSSKIALAHSKRVPVVAEAQISLALNTPPIDLCVILGNLLDNAIEANLPLPEDARMIRVFMEMKGAQLYISVTNMASSKKKPKLGGLFRTDKGDGHGFGLVRIDGIVEKHGGYISRNSEDGAFTTEVLLPQ